MNNKVYSVDEVAEMLDMHPRTIRRYIKEGKLKADKIGKFWKIKNEYLKEMMGSEDFLKSADDIWTQNIHDFLSDKNEITHKVEICCIADLKVNQQEAQNISSKIISLMNSVSEKRKYAKMQYQYNSKMMKARFIFWGNPEFVAILLNQLGGIENDKI